MSALLQALKKAADLKSQELKSKESIDSKQPDILQKEEDYNESNSKNISTPSHSASEVKSEDSFALNFTPTLESSTKEDSEPNLKNATIDEPLVDDVVLASSLSEDTTEKSDMPEIDFANIKLAPEETSSQIVNVDSLDTDNESKPELKPEPKLEPQPELKPELKPEPKLEPQPELKSEPKLEPKLEPKSEPNPEHAHEPMLESDLSMDDKPQPPLAEQKEINELKSAEESFDWSLDNIPAYKDQQGNIHKNTEHDEKKDKEANDNQEKSNESEAKEIFSTLNSPLKKTRKYSLLSILLAILFFLLIGSVLALYFYSYYENALVENEQSLNQYRLPTVKKQKMAKPSKEPKEPKINKNESVSSPKSASQLTSKPIAVNKKIKHPVPKTKKVVLKKRIIKKVVKKTVVKKTKVIKKVFKQPHTEIKKKPQLLEVHSTPSLENKAYQAYSNKKFGLAKKYYQDILKNDPENVSALFGLGAIAVQDGEVQKAIQYYKKVIMIDPYYKGVKEALAMAKASQSVTHNNLNNLKKLLLKNPNDGALNYAIGNYYAKTNNWVEAEKYYFNAVSGGYNNFNSVLNLAISFDHLGEYALAKKYYQKSISMVFLPNQQPKVDVAKKRIAVLKEFLSKRNLNVH